MMRYFMLVLLLGMLLTGCPKNSVVDTLPVKIEEVKKPDIDLARLSSTMAYSGLNDILANPDNYKGKQIKLKGMFAVLTNQNKTMFYPAVVIQDVAACCSLCMEFILEGNPSYPDGYPETGKEITVTGLFETYNEAGTLYYHLVNAELE